jgi:hypothetical protein
VACLEEIHITPYEDIMLHHFGTSELRDFRGPKVFPTIFLEHETPELFNLLRPIKYNYHQSKW